MFAANEDWLVVVAPVAWLFFGILILVVVRLLPAGDRPLSRSPGRLFFTVLAWVFLALGILVTLNLLGVLVLIVIGLVCVRGRRSRRQAMLWTLAVAADKSIPLSSAIEAFANEESALSGDEARALGRLLNSGTPLPEALTFLDIVVPREAVVPVYVGHESGALAAGLRQATAPAGPLQSVWDQMAGKVAYLCFAVLLAMGVVTFMAIKVAPAFQKIFADFDAELPTISAQTITMLGALAWPVAILCLLSLWLFFYAILRYLGAISWDLPPLGHFTRRLHTARILDALALAVERSQPLNKALATVARCYPRWAIRWRLQGVVVDVTCGVDWVQSLRDRGLISAADLAVLHAAQRVGNLAWALREIADGHRRRLAYRWQTRLQILFPAAIVCFGLLVLLFWVSYFLPLIALIQRLT